MVGTLGVGEMPDWGQAGDDGRYTGDGVKRLMGGGDRGAGE